MDIDDEFDELYETSFLRAAECAGFVTAPRSGVPLSRLARIGQVRSCADRARDALLSLSPSLADDDPLVREVASDGLSEVLRVAHSAERESPAPQALPFLLADRAVRFLVGRAPQQEYGHQFTDRLRRARAAALVGVLLSYVGAALFVLQEAYVVAGPLLLCGIGFDLLEGAIGRVRKIASARDRWVTCLASHALEVGLFSSFAGVAYRNGWGALSLVIMATGSMALFGSTARLSALQVGFRFARSLEERAIRSIALLFMLFGSGLWHGPGRLWLGAALFGLFGVYESAIVFQKVLGSSAVQGAFVFRHRDRTVELWSFDDDDDRIDEEASAVAMSGL